MQKVANGSTLNVKIVQRKVGEEMRKLNENME